MTSGGIIVTGAKGFVGTALCKEIARRYPSMQLWQLDLPEWDLREEQTLRAVSEFRPFVVFHLAAHHFIPWCNEHVAETFELNVTATYRLLKAAHTARKFVFASSAAVYGLAETWHTTFSENDVRAPVDVYGTTKLLGEDMILHHALRDGAIATVAARLFNVVGPDGADGVPHLHPKVMRHRGGTMECDVPSMRLHRDYVHVDDVAAALLNLAEHMKYAGYMPVNVCSGVSLNGEEMCQFYDVAMVDDTRLRRPTSGHLRGNNQRLIDTVGSAPTAPWERLLTAEVVR